MAARWLDRAAAVGMLAFCAGFPIAFVVIGTGR